MAVYDDEKTYTPGDHDNLGTSAGDRAKEIADLEAAYNDTPKDDQPEDNDSYYEKGILGSGYNPGTKKGGFFSNLTNRRVAFISGILGGGIVGLWVFMSAVLPWKSLFLTTMVENYTKAQVNEAMQITNDNLLSSYYVNYVLNSVDSGVCKSTIKPGCVITGRATGPVGKVFDSWRQNKLEQKLAKNYGIIVDKRNGKLFMTVSGTEIAQESLVKLRTGQIKITELEGRNKINKTELRNQIRSAFEHETKWKRLYHRFQYSRLLSKRWGVKFCVIACSYIDSFSSTIKEKKIAGKLFLSQKVGGIMGENFNILLQCVIDTPSCESNIDQDSDGEPTSKIQKNLSEKLNSYRDREGSAKLAQLVTRADDINRLGLSGYATREIGNKIAKLFGKEISQEVTEKVIGKVVPYVGWISLALSLRENLPQLGKSLRYISYASNVAEAVTFFAVYQSAAAESKSGHTDLTELGSLTNQLSVGPEVTAAPMYKVVSGETTNNSSNNIGSLLINSAYAISDGVEKPNLYKCPPGVPMQSNGMACEDEDFNNAGVIGNGVFNVLNNKTVKFFVSAGDLSLKPFYVLNDVYQTVSGWLATPISWATEKACTLAPFCALAGEKLRKLGGEFLVWVRDQAIPHPVKFAFDSSARAFQMMVAGGLAAYSESGKSNLGGSVLSQSDIQAIQYRRLQDERAEFESLPLFSRLFSRESTHSLVAQVVLNTPSSQTSVQSMVATLFNNPLNKTAEIAGNFNGKKDTAYAAQPHLSQNPFGIKIIGYKVSDIPREPLEYWEKNCANRDYKKEWRASMVLDETTGSVIPTRTEPCMLIDATIKSAGGLFDASFNDADNAVVSDGIGSVEGFTFPLKTSRSAIVSNNPQWCYSNKSNCHHDYPAADIFSKPGTEVIAAVSGTVINAKNNDTSSCAPTKGGSPSTQIKGSDGRYYFYTHFAAGSLVVSKGQKVKAGDKLGKVGDKSCAMGTSPHLHIQWFSSLIMGDGQSMNIQPPLVKSFGALPE